MPTSESPPAPLVGREGELEGVVQVTFLNLGNELFVQGGLSLHPNGQKGAEENRGMGDAKKQAQPQSPGSQGQSGTGTLRGADLPAGGRGQKDRQHGECQRRGREKDGIAPNNGQKTEDGYDQGIYCCNGEAC